jgi:hypothetical protein
MIKKPSRKKPITPNSQIKAALHQLWMRSRERASALKRDGYRCQKCQIKQSVSKANPVKINVHHREGVQNWPALIAAVREYLLCDPDFMEVLCVECHNEEHGRIKDGNI